MEKAKLEGPLVTRDAVAASVVVRELVAERLSPGV
jgi:hypothetical protein